MVYYGIYMLQMNVRMKFDQSECSQINIVYLLNQRFLLNQDTLSNHTRIVTSHFLNL